MNTMEELVNEADWIMSNLMHELPQGFSEDDFARKAKGRRLPPQAMAQSFAEWESLGHIEKTGASMLSERNTPIPAWRVRTR